MRSTSDKLHASETALCRRHGLAEACHHPTPQEQPLWATTRYPIFILAISFFYADYAVFAVFSVYLNHKPGPSVLAAQRCFAFISSSRFAYAACPLNGFDTWKKGKREGRTIWPIGRYLATLQ
jgi:hypothetical protein